jgi:phage shock protein A
MKIMKIIKGVGWEMSDMSDVNPDKLAKTKNFVLHLLQNDVEIQNEILKIVSKNERQAGAGYEQNDECNDGRADELESECKRVNREYNALLLEHRKLKTRFETLEGENKESVGRYTQVLSLYKELEDSYNNLKQENACLSKQLAEQNRSIQEKDSLHEEQLRQLQSDKSKIEIEVERIHKNYGRLDDVYSKYLALESSVQKKLERVLSPTDKISDSAELFFAYGIQENDVLALWEVICTNVNMFEQEKCLDDLCGIFNYFLRLYTNISFKETTISVPKKGDAYDERYHTRTPDSAATGEIQKVILPGFTIGKNITKKALVVVK